MLQVSKEVVNSKESANCKAQKQQEPEIAAQLVNILSVKVNIVRFIILVCWFLGVFQL